MSFLVVAAAGFVDIHQKKTNIGLNFVFCIKAINVKSAFKLVVYSVEVVMITQSE